MLPEQQQRILGYFLEEANDHLNTIEQGLLNLQSTLADSEMVNEIFRAAHSIKGGAAMLGLNSIQRTAHRLEDFFKILKECPSIQIDQNLESLFLQVFDNLKALLEQLQSGAGLSDSEASRLMSQVEPVFAALEHQLSVLVGQAGGTMHPDELPIPAVSATAPAWATAFEHSVPEALRELLQLFKQPETPQTRKQLQECCNQLAQLGKEYDLSGWLTLCETAAGAIANADNSYRTLAPVIIRELKQAQDLVLANRAAEITICEQLQALSINTFLLDWEEDNSSISFEPEEIQVLPTVVDNEVKATTFSTDFSDFSPQAQIDSLSVDDDLSSLFIPKSDSNNQWQETTDLLGVLNDGSEDSLLQDTETQFLPISSEETLALNNLFGEAQDTALNSIDEEPAFCDLFSAPTADVESIAALEELNPLGDSENIALNQFWTEETDSSAQVEAFDLEDAVNSSTEAIAAAEIELELGNELAVSDDFTAFVPQVESWSTEPEFDLGAIADTADLASVSIFEIPSDLDLNLTVDSTTANSFTDFSSVAASSVEDSLLPNPIADRDSTEPATEWDSDTEGVGLDIDAIPTIEIDSSLSAIAEIDAIESSGGWEVVGEGQLDFDGSALELSDNLSFEPESSLEQFTAPADESAPDFMAGWDAGSEEPELGFHNTATDLFASPAPEAAALPNFSPEESTEEGDRDNTELMAAWDSQSEVLEMGFDSPVMELGDRLSFESESSAEFFEPSASMPLDEESATASNAWDAGEGEMDFDATPAQMEESPNLESESSLELDDNFSLAAETPAEETALMAGWDADGESLEMGFDSTGMELGDRLSFESESSDNFLTDSSIAATDDCSSAELMAGWNTGSEESEMGFDSALSDRLSFESESSSEQFAPSASMPLDEEGTPTSAAWDIGEAELGLDYDATLAESGDSLSLESGSKLELDDDFSLAAEVPAVESDTALMAGWDVGAETLEMGFDTAAMELGDSLNLEPESSYDLLADSSLAATEDLSSDELMVGWDAGSEALAMSLDDESATASTAWDAGEEMDWGFDAIPAESEDNPSLELEPSLELDDNFSMVTETDADLSSSSTAAIIEENITELMTVVESIYQGSAENEILLGEAQADFLADSQMEADDDFPELDALLEEEESVTNAIATAEALLDISSAPIAPAPELPAATTSPEDDFGDLEQLLQSTPKAATATSTTQSSSDDFGDLEQLLQSTPTKTASVAPTQPAPAPPQQTAPTPSPRRPAFEQMMRVPVKQLDSIGNMVGELVVYRNSLEQDQERLRQFLDNLLHQVQQLGDVGTRIQELYERSLLEASLLNSRQGARLISVANDGSTSAEERHATGVNFDALEMDRFTGFHTLAQEMIELIVRVREASSDIEFVTGETEQVARNFRQVTTHLQEGITRSRMVPFSQIAERLPRAVRDIALKYGKQAELEVEGNETLIDKVILEQLYDPMTHLVNNAITHGIETSEERVAKGKAAAGKISIRAFHQGNQTVITVSDDGAGIDPEKVKAKAIANGLITPAEADSMARLDVFNLIFQPGFSTKEQVDQFAGRGIGMDVVLTSLKQMRGVIHTDSHLGKGTTFTIRLPLTLSICKALCCVSDKARIAFPMDGVEQMMDIPVDEVVANAEGQTCIPWRDSLLPFRPLKELLGFTRQLGRGSIYGSSREDNAISIVVLRSADMFFALQVDQVLGEQEIVIKQFEAPAPKPAGIAGATILGDGRIMPIADVLELIDLSVGRIQKDGRGTVWSPRHIPAPPVPVAPVKTEPLVLIVDDSITVRELLSMTFTNAGYRVEQARDGQEAWDKLRDGLPCDLVFCDIEMPRMDGLELLSRMQKEERLSQLPIAMLTSRGSDRHRQMALQLGASGYFTKPYLEEALLDGAQRMLKGEVLIAASSASNM
jgi:chemosensory pili system protein ChpA (sensor histidine kinase/response regulator)